MGCRVCRARKVKCDGRPNGCRNCERLHLTCVDDSSSTATLPLTLGSIRTYRSCTNCRSSKTKCNGDRPRCSRCVARSMDCVYVGGSVPRWASTIEGPYSRRTSSAEAGSLPRSGAGASSNHSSSPPERPQPDRQDSSGNDHAMEDRDAGAAPPTDGSDPAASAPSSAPPAPAVAQAPSPPRPLHHHAEAPMMPPISTIAPIAALPPKTPITPSQPQNSLEVGAMAWLLAEQLPSRRNTRSLVEQYFAHIHPIRCFAFVHKPSFMRQLDAGFSREDDMALLYIICAHGAKFHVMTLGQFGQEPSPSFLRAAGNQWATKAEQILIGKYGRVSVPRLMALVLLHDFHLRLGRYNQALVLSGITIRLAQALRIHSELAPDLLCTDDPDRHSSGSGNTELSAVFMESRRRLMWACYTLDAWTSNAGEQLSILREADIKVQLPCNERNFGLRIPCVTETLGLGHVLQFLPPAIVPARPAENMGIMAYYVRIVALRKKISQYIRNYPSGPGPWQSDSEFSALDADMRHWRRTLPDFVEYSPDTIYARLDSNQLGGLMLIHCTYHDSYLELYKISMPVLFGLGGAPEWPPAQQELLQALQADCYFHARQVSRLIAEAAEHDGRLLSDSMLPLFLYDSSRIMLYYAGMLLDRARVDAADRLDEAVAAVTENARLLREMMPMFPISESFVVTVEHWLSKVRMTSLSSARGTTSDDAATATTASYSSAAGTDRTSPFSSRHSVSAVSEFALAPVWPSSRRSLAYAASDRPASSRPLVSPSASSNVGERTPPNGGSGGMGTGDDSRAGLDHAGAAEGLLGLSGQTTPVDKTTSLPKPAGTACGLLTLEDLQIFSSWDIQSIVDDVTSASGSGTEATRTNVGWNGR